jgi:hypothetical protein
MALLAHGNMIVGRRERAALGLLVRRAEGLNRLADLLIDRLLLAREVRDVQERAAVRRILEHLGLDATYPQLERARGPPEPTFEW